MSPVYEYRCGRCDEAVSVVKPMAQATEPEPCPICRRPMVREFTPIAPHVKSGTPGFHRPR